MRISDWSSDVCSSDLPVSMQLVGCTPYEMGEAAKLNEDRGAAIIDINMGCPVRKVTNGDAGSALMREPKLAAALIEACVKAVEVPVTVKMRMGWEDRKSTRLNSRQYCASRRPSSARKTNKTTSTTPQPQ